MSSRSGASSAGSAASGESARRRSATSTVATDTCARSDTTETGSCRATKGPARQAGPTQENAARAQAELLDCRFEVAALGQQVGQVVVAVHLAGRDAAAVGLLGGLLVAHLVGVEVAQGQPGHRLAELGAALQDRAGLGLPAGLPQQ